MASPSNELDIAQPEQCLWCRKKDYSAVYGDRLLLTCDSCLNAFCHLACDAVRRGGPALSREAVAGTTPWFCSEDCAQVHAALAEATNARRTPVSRDGAYTFELVQHAPSGPGGGKSEGSAQYTATACATAVKVFHSAFSPLVMEDGQDMVELVCHSAFDNANGTTDFSGFRTALLRHRGTVVCAATLRLFGKAFAEMPFVATREGQRKAGHCRRLLAALEARLLAWGVRHLLLPSVPETQTLWTQHFGFVRMSAAESAAVQERIIMPEAETTVMLKKLILAPTQPIAARGTAEMQVSPELPQPRSRARPAAAEGASAGCASSDAPRPAAPLACAPRGTGSFSSLSESFQCTSSAKSPPGGAAAALAASSMECHKLGHMLADVLLSTMIDADDERRTAQAALHALRMCLQERDERLAAMEGLKAELLAKNRLLERSAAEAEARVARVDALEMPVAVLAAQPTEMELDVGPPSPPSSPGGPSVIAASPPRAQQQQQEQEQQQLTTAMDVDEDGDAAMAMLRAIAAEPDELVVRTPAAVRTPPTHAATPQAEADADVCPAETAHTAAAVRAESVQPVVPLPEVGVGRAEALRMVAAVLLRLPPGQSTWWQSEDAEYCHSSR